MIKDNVIKQKAQTLFGGSADKFIGEFESIEAYKDHLVNTGEFTRDQVEDCYEDDMGFVHHDGKVYAFYLN
jgi:hypothetical protein